mmetsp:Transcript_2568/g.7764  ORF Transcript_2568/g.7764 Transcript_2568/m.7764 type:complete len:125 (-) Transcript_2568:1278-1652(-)
MMSVHTLSRNPESCDTIIEDISVLVVKYSTSHATFVVSMWLVGSSRSRMSAPMSMARASASFIRQPPESDLIVDAWSCSENPISVSTSITRSLDGDWASCTTGSSKMRSTTAVSLTDPSRSWAT